MSRSGATGLTKKSEAPCRIAVTTVSSEELAVWTMTGVLRFSRAMVSSTAMPSRSGMTRSSTMTPIVGSLRSASSACRPPLAVIGTKPARRAVSDVKRN